MLSLSTLHFTTQDSPSLHCIAPARDIEDVFSIWLTPNFLANCSLVSSFYSTFTNFILAFLNFTHVLNVDPFLPHFFSFSFLGSSHSLSEAKIMKLKLALDSWSPWAWFSSAQLVHTSSLPALTLTSSLPALTLYGHFLSCFDPSSLLCLLCHRP